MGEVTGFVPPHDGVPDFSLPQKGVPACRTGRDRRGDDGNRGNSARRNGRGGRIASRVTVSTLCSGGDA
ncbi:MAG TPA: hypothetical protein PKA20_12450 [Burkholderiaceae bacterium]|nr:hypothetical protein [Burkholderiaceae bacterium]